MDFFNSMSDTQKIVLGFAIVTLLIAIVIYFCNGKKDENMNISQSSTTPISNTESGTEKVLVMCFAPWCGHCKAMAPAWSEFVKNFDGYNGVKLLKINGQENQSLMETHKISGFPSVKFCPLGIKSSEGVMYDGDRTVQSLADFLQQHA